MTHTHISRGAAEQQKKPALANAEMAFGVPMGVFGAGYSSGVVGDFNASRDKHALAADLFTGGKGTFVLRRQTLANLFHDHELNSDYCASKWNFYESLC